MGDDELKDAAGVPQPGGQFPWPALTPWTHPKTGGLYLVLGVARCSTNGPREGVEKSVVYWSFAKRHLCYREYSEFMDGRFEEYDHERQTPRGDA